MHNIYLVNDFFYSNLTVPKDKEFEECIYEKKPNWLSHEAYTFAVMLLMDIYQQ